MVGSCGSSTFLFLRSFYTVFHSGYTNLPSHQKGQTLGRFPFPKAICRVSAVLIKIPMAFSQIRTNNLKICMETQNTQNTVINL